MKKTNDPQNFSCCRHCGSHHILRGRQFPASREWQALFCAIDSAKELPNPRRRDNNTPPCRGGGPIITERSYGRTGRWIARNLRAAYRLSEAEALAMLELWALPKDILSRDYIPGKDEEYIPRLFKLRDIRGFGEIKDAALLEAPRYSQTHGAILLHTTKGPRLYIPGRIYAKKGKLKFALPYIKRL